MKCTDAILPLLMILIGPAILVLYACGASQIAHDAPIAGEVALLQSEVICLIDRTAEGMLPEQANAACLVDPSAAKRAAGAAVCSRHASRAPLTVLVQAVGRYEAATDAASAVVSVLVNVGDAGARWPPLDAPSELNTWSPQSILDQAAGP